MKIVCVSDTHTLHKHVNVPDGDVFIHAGDMTNIGEDQDLLEVSEWISDLPHKHKIVICGNHEKKYSEDTESIKAYFECFGIKVLHNETITIDGFKFYGEPRTPEFYNWGWAYNPGYEAELVWEKMPEGIDVLVCHGPPLGYGDIAPRLYGFCQGSAYKEENHVGCPTQLKHLKRVQPKLVVCGHIHFSHGIYMTDFGTTVVNASICTEAYKPTNKPIVVNLVKEKK